MKRLITICLVVGMVLAVSSVTQATWLSMDITGVIEAPGSAHVDDWMQVGPIGPHGDFDWGTIDSYSASPDLPQNEADDLWAYGWSMQGTITSITGYVINSSGTGYMMAPGYDYDTESEYLESFTWTMVATYDDDWSSAVVTGTLTAELGTRQPDGWPEPVDWSSANPGILNGTFTSADNTLVATIIPEPATIALLGLGSLVLIRRKRRT